MFFSNSSNFCPTNSISDVSANPWTTSSNESILPVKVYQPAMSDDNTVTIATMFCIDNPNFAFCRLSTNCSASTCFAFFYSPYKSKPNDNIMVSLWKLSVL